MLSLLAPLLALGSLPLLCSRGDARMASSGLAAARGVFSRDEYLPEVLRAPPKEAVGVAPARCLPDV